MRTKSDLVADASFRFLKHFVAHTGILKHRRNYQSKPEYVEGIARALTTEECTFLREAASDSLSPEEAAETFLQQYRPDEAVVRQRFVEFLKSEFTESVEEEAIFFEFPIAGNRADVNRFNGVSYTYELKSPRDTGYRLQKQLAAYRAVFDKVYVVVPEEEEFGPLPAGIGKFTYDYPEFEFRLECEAEICDELEPKHQLERLRVPELKEIRDSMAIPIEDNRKKQELVNALHSHLEPEKVNSLFKEKVKGRYLRAK